VIRPSRALALLAVSAVAAAASAPGDYGLRAQPVADGVYAFLGTTNGFDHDNGGNIVNTGFIVGPEGIIVIDSGPSRLYGEQQRAAIARVSPLPVRRVLITHAHPDHFLGDQAYPPAEIAALPATIAGIRTHGEALSNNLYQLVGGWMRGTEVVIPQQAVASGKVTIAGRELQLYGDSGHTDGDLMIYDLKTRTLFTGDLVFYDRAPTTPNANMTQWLASLDQIDRLDCSTLVPGHGAITHGHEAIAQTRDYLTWLETRLRDAANHGLDMTEVMRQPIPERFRSLAQVDAEYARSISHLYPAIELGTLPAIASNP
jgi:uncharacterized sulfatase